MVQLEMGLSNYLCDEAWEALSGSLVLLLAPGSPFTGEREQG